MTDPNSLRLDPELSAIGVSDEVIEALGGRATTGLDGMQALRRGIIDAARVWEGETELGTPEDVRDTKEYAIGFDANSTVIMGKKAA